MRAMILAAGLGKRLRPLSTLRPKSALPVRGIPLIAYGLEWLAHQGVREVAINLHHLPAAVRRAADQYRPPGLELHFWNEPQLLDTGGGIRRAAGFLREADPCVVVAADMLLDLELAPLVRRHREGGDAVTLVLRDDPRSARFGTIGFDGSGRVRRIARRLDLGGEVGAGLYMSVTLLSPTAFAWMPEEDVFGYLDAWIGARLREGGSEVGAVRLGPEACRWEPVGTLQEYLRVNLDPPPLSYFDPDPRARQEGTRFEPGLVIGAGAELAPGARLERAVVWDGERVAADVQRSDGVFAGGRFHACNGEGGASG